jgi:ATP:corrinoid adenosyltransferase
LRARTKHKGDGTVVARVLDWHELAIQNRIKKHVEAVQFLERALEILQDYSFTDDLVAAQADEVSGALNDILVALDELAAVLNTSPSRAEAMPQGAGPTAFG